MTFAELNYELAFLQPSYLNYRVSVLINCDKPKRLQGFIEHTLWHQAEKASQRLESCLFLTTELLAEEVKFGTKVEETLIKERLTVD